MTSSEILENLIDFCQMVIAENFFLFSRNSTRTFTFSLHTALLNYYRNSCCFIACGRLISLLDNRNYGSNNFRPGRNKWWLNISFLNSFPINITKKSRFLDLFNRRSHRRINLEDLLDNQPCLNVHRFREVKVTIKSLFKDLLWIHHSSFFVISAKSLFICSLFFILGIKSHMWTPVFLRFYLLAKRSVTTDKLTH